MTACETVLRTIGLSRVVGDKAIVSDISIEVARGDVLAIVGPSGSGKSTFLRLLNRLDEPTSGTVFLDGQDYRQISPRTLRRQVGMVLQTPYLFPGTVSDNVCFGPSQWGRSLDNDEIGSILSRVGLSGYGSRSVSNLSGGEAQRVSIARTLANKPEVVLLDEPTSALDEQSKGEIEALLKEILVGGSLTCLIVTHDMAQAARMASTVMLIDAGRMVRMGPAEEVLRAEPTVP